MIFFPPPPPSPPYPDNPPPTPESSILVRFGPFWVRFGCISGPSWGVGSGRGGVVERGFCKGKEYHYPAHSGRVTQDCASPNADVSWSLLPLSTRWRARIRIPNDCYDHASVIGRAKTLQTVTLQVKICLFFLCCESSAQGVNKKMVGNNVLFLNDFLPALNIHLQCYHLQCFSFARCNISGTHRKYGNEILWQCSWRSSGELSGPFNYETHTSMCSVLKLFRIVRAKVRLNFRHSMSYLPPEYCFPYPPCKSALGYSAMGSTLPINFGTPPRQKELLACLAVDFCAGKTGPRPPGGQRARQRGVQKTFWEEYRSWGSLPSTRLQHQLRETPDPH